MKYVGFCYLYFILYTATFSTRSWNGVIWCEEASDTFFVFTKITLVLNKFYLFMLREWIFHGRHRWIHTSNFFLLNVFTTVGQIVVPTFSSSSSWNLLQLVLDVQAHFELVLLLLLWLWWIPVTDQIANSSPLWEKFLIFANEINRTKTDYFAFFMTSYFFQDIF